MSEIEELGPWFHRIHLGGNVWTREGRDYPKELWEAIEPHLNIDENTTVWDIGCADGYMTVECAKRGAWVEAIDPWNKAIARCRFVVTKLGLDQSVITWQTTATEYEIFHKFYNFDIVLCLGVVYHLGGISEISRTIDLLKKRCKGVAFVESVVGIGEDGWIINPLGMNPDGTPGDAPRYWPSKNALKKELEQRFKKVTELPYMQGRQLYKCEEPK